MKPVSYNAATGTFSVTGMSETAAIHYTMDNNSSMDWTAAEAYVRGIKTMYGIIPDLYWDYVDPLLREGSTIKAISLLRRLMTADMKQVDPSAAYTLRAAKDAVDARRADPKFNEYV